MKTDLTDITLVVDRSGSMQDIRSDAEGGVNAFIENQAKEPGEALLTLVQFDTEFEFLHTGVPIKDVPRYSLVPRGSTALLDAVGRAINETGERISKLAEAERPALVVFVVMTDGLENSSPTSPTTGQKVSFPRDLWPMFSLHLILDYSLWQSQAELFEQNLLMFRWAADAATTDRAA